MGRCIRGKRSLPAPWLLLRGWDVKPPHPNPSPDPKPEMASRWFFACGALSKILKRFWKIYPPFRCCSK